MKIHGTTYKQGSVIRITSNDAKGDLPFLYAQIVHVYVYQDFKIFITNTLSISDFVNNLRAISVDVTNNSLVCCPLSYLVMGSFISNNMLTVLTS